jgi:NTP pyrophosphatase (non-canonical NTP hydrolase)
MINKKLDYNTELMLITMEECGELIEACSKTIRCEDYIDDAKMIEEVGDVSLMIELIIENGLLKKEDIDARKKVKIEKLKKWSNLIK